MFNVSSENLEMLNSKVCLMWVTLVLTSNYGDREEEDL